MSKHFKTILISIFFIATANADWIGYPNWNRTSMSATESSNYTNTYPATNVVDDWNGTPPRDGFCPDGGGFGLRDDFNGSWHGGSTFFGTTTVSPSGTSTREWLRFDFGKYFELTSIDFWNHNRAGVTGRGLKDISIDVSNDGINWTTVWTGQIAKAPGTLPSPLPGSCVNNMYQLFIGIGKQTTANLGGIVVARHVIINAHTNWGYDGYFALDEVRFNGNKRSSPVAQVPPANIYTWASSEHTESLSAVQTVAGYETTFVNGLHTNSSSGYGMWLSGSGGGASTNPSPSGTSGRSWIAYDFGTIYDLDSIWVWNYNQSGATNRGLRNVTIDYSYDGLGWQTFGSFVIPQAAGVDQMSHNFEIDLSGLNARYVVIIANSINGNWGDTGPHYGLSEIQFYGTVRPDLIEYPSPNAECVETDLSLSWNAIANAQYYEVYVGDDYSSVLNAQRLGGDLNASGVVDWNDLLLAAENWLVAPLEPFWFGYNSIAYQIDFGDFAVLANEWLRDSGSSYRGRVSGTELDATLDTCKNYYWRVDVLSASGVQKGLMYSFKTHCGQAQSEYYVSPSGNDANPGTLGLPFKTIEAARTAVRGKCLPQGGTNIYLRGGNYFRTSQLFLDSYDGGPDEDSPLVYQSYPGEEARIIGGVQLDPSWFTIVNSSSPAWNRIHAAARGSVYVCDLAANGITNYGTFSDNFNRPDVYFNRQRMQIARWPNSGYETTRSVVDYLTYGYYGTQPSNWSTAPDAWVGGYWYYGYHFDYRRIGSIDTAQQSIRLQSQPYAGLLAGKLWHALNLLEELDIPGEWYLDRAAGKLYLWPISGISGSEIVMSTLGTLDGSIVRTQETSNLVFRDLTFEMCRFRAIRLIDGENVTIDNCRIKNIGEYAVAIQSGTNHTLQNSIIHNTGGTAVYAAGGDRPSLESSEHLIRNNQIFDFGLWQRIFTPGVWLDGVGVKVEHNTIYNGPHFGIYHTGNNHNIRYNHIAYVCYEVDDAGVIYGGRDWGYRGNKITNNLIRDISSIQPLREGVFGVYMDDCYSSADVFGNVFYNINGRAFVIGGGRDNLLRNNVVARSGSVLYADKRGLTMGVIGGGDPSWDLLGKIQAMNYTQPPWSTAYPALAAILDNGWDEAKAPRGNLFANNIGWLNSQWTYGDGINYVSISNNLNQDPLFLDESNYNLALHDYSPAYSIPGFVRIPFEMIGTLSMTQATRPNPHSGRVSVSVNTKFYWAPAAGGVSRDIYLGTNYNSVLNATSGSAEFKSNTANTYYNPGTLSPGQTYYWRIDERDKNGDIIQKGTVWQFNT